MLAIAKADGFETHALTFDYGQRHAFEIKSARTVATRLGASEHVIARIDLRIFGGSALTAELPVPKGRTAEEVSVGIPITYVLMGMEMLEERKERRQPHILKFDEEARLIAVSPNHLRMLVILILETGQRSKSEALALRWEDVDLTNDTIRIGSSKSLAGRHCVPISTRCKAELLRWRSLCGTDASPFVFNRPGDARHYGDLRAAWTKTLELAGIRPFRMYDLRHAFATRMIAAGNSPVFVAQILGHSNPSILHVYARAVDEFQRSAIVRLEAFRAANVASVNQRDTSDPRSLR